MYTKHVVCLHYPKVSETTAEKKQSPKIDYLNEAAFNFVSGPRFDIS